MKRYEVRERTTKVRELVETRCDLCGEEEHLWGKQVEKKYDTHSIIESHIFLRICCYQRDDGHDSEELEFDLCPRCFKEKLIPWMGAQGAMVQRQGYCHEN